jgi:prepilin-type N-terminal cleavage/methylation domain-containing protein
MVSQQHRAFTLLEIILVLALMVVFATLAGASLRSGFRHQRLRKAAEQIRNEWTRARVESIKNGRAYVFYHAQQGNQFLVMPQASLDDVLPTMMGDANANQFQNQSQFSSQLSSSQRSTGFGNSSNAAANPYSVAVRQRELPEGVQFFGADVQFDQRSAVQLNQTPDPSTFTQFDLGFDSQSLQDQQWGVPVYFFPDGTSSTAQLILTNDRNEAVRVYLRGLTGLVRVGSVEPLDAMSSPEMYR